jgi:hypothetical protein
MPDLKTGEPLHPPSAVERVGRRRIKTDSYFLNQETAPFTTLSSHLRYSRHRKRLKAENWKAYQRWGPREILLVVAALKGTKFVFINTCRRESCENAFKLSFSWRAILISIHLYRLVYEGIADNILAFFMGKGDCTFNITHTEGLQGESCITHLSDLHWERHV